MFVFKRQQTALRFVYFKICFMEKVKIKLETAFAYLKSEQLRMATLAKQSTVSHTKIYYDAQATAFGVGAHEVWRCIRTCI